MSNTNILRELQEENKRLRDELAKYKPSWDDAPEWANWLGSDEDGDWIWYSHEPVFSMGGWFSPEIPNGEQWQYKKAGDVSDMIGWLEERP